MRTFSLRLASGQERRLSHLFAGGFLSSVAALHGASAQTAPAVTAPTGIEWRSVAQENQNFSLSASGVVRYGSDSRWVERSLGVGTSHACTNSYFGSDPAVGTFKRCELRVVSSATNIPPVITMTSPPQGAGYTAGTTITLRANATDSDGRIARVVFYSNSTQLATVTTAPYTFAWNNVPTGTYNIRARAVDNQGAATVSSGRQITVTGGGGGGGGGVTYRLSVTVSGNGSVTSDGINCTTECSSTPSSGTVVTLTARPATGSSFVGWTGACSGSGLTCTVTMSQARTVRAEFMTSSGGGGGGGSGGDHVYIDRSRIPAPFLGYSNTRITGAHTSVGAGDGTGSFRTTCVFGHMNFDDPIVYPGQPNMAHLHTYFGNTAADAYSTVNSIANSGNSTCSGGILNRSAYWVPSMIDTRNGAPVKPREGIFYYKTGYANGAPLTSIQPMPAGLRMIAGDHTLKGPVPRQSWEKPPVNFTCQPSGISSETIPNCPGGPGAELRQHVYFPQCWDGRNLDSSNHKSHMAFRTDGPGGTKVCPSTHPVLLPEITFNIVYDVPTSNLTQTWRLSSDMYPSTQPAGYSNHGDWFNGWNQGTVNIWLRNCLHTARDCHANLLGDGTELN
jgi:Domain of unknown function (DUF1996)/Bacterial Ig domain/Divergent InlB B-repeat domain